jgi:hypothetical protein
LSSIKKKAALKALAAKKKKQRELDAKPKFDLKKFCFPKQYDFVVDDAKFKTAVCSRRCLAEGTWIPTTEGFKKIENVQPGDKVYDEWGKQQVVKAVVDNGTQTVHAYGYHKSVPLFYATRDHKFLTTNRKQGKNLINAVIEGVKTTGRYNPYSIKRGAYCISGTKNVEMAYTLGKNLRLMDMNILKTWNRESQTKYLAGFVDNNMTITTINKKEERVRMQSRGLDASKIEQLELLFLNLAKVHLKVADVPYSWRNDKEKALEVPLRKMIRIHSSFDLKKILKICKPYLKKNVNTLYYANNYKDVSGMEFRKGRLRMFAKTYKTAQTYDLQLESNTNLYQLACGAITHNSGKTVSCAADLYNTASNNAEANCLYITLNRKSAKRIIWKDLLKIVKEYEDPGSYSINHSDLEITLSNGSVIYLSGAKDKSEIEKFRGMSLKLVYIDECQSFRGYIEDLIDDVIMPCLYDQNGKLALIGTPGPVSAGYFYEQAHSPVNSNHKWTMFDNPWIKWKTGREPEDIIAEELRRRGVDETNPTHRRENMGEWVYDADALVFKFDRTKNIYYDLPGDLQYIMGIDVGYHDADAVAVLGFSVAEKKVYLVEEDVERKQGIEELVTKIKYYHDKYDIVKSVMDTGGLGKKIQEEIIKRHSLAIEPAEKTRKFEFIELLNDDLRTSRLQAFEGSIFEEDTYKVQWDMDDKHRLKVSNTYHSDITDAVLYAWRECYHFVGKLEPEVRADKYTQEYADLVEMELAQRLRQKAEGEEDAISMEDIDELEGYLDEW